MHNGATFLDHYEFIRVSGKDSLSFLQGQLSCNTELLSPERSLTGVLCNVKGRVIADFRLFADGEDCILQCAQQMAGTVLETLRKYAVFSQVTLEQLTADAPAVIGLCGSAVENALASLQLTLPEGTDGVQQGGACSVIRLPGESIRAELWMQSTEALQAFLSQCDTKPERSLDAWNRAEIESGMIHITPELSEEYTPQLLNYDIAGLIDFKKGCYTGQEIVARMYYRGTAKKRLYLACTDSLVTEESRVVRGGATDSVGGKVLRFSNAGTSALLLAVLENDLLGEPEALQLSGQPNSEVKILSMPYADPREGSAS